MQLSAKQIQRKPIPSETITAFNQKPFAEQNFCDEKTDQGNSKCLLIESKIDQVMSSDCLITKTDPGNTKHQVFV